MVRPPVSAWASQFAAQCLVLESQTLQLPHSTLECQCKQRAGKPAATRETWTSSPSQHLPLTDG